VREGAGVAEVAPTRPARQRLRAHAPELAIVATVLVGLRMAGVSGVGPVWLSPALLVLAALVSLVVHGRWGRAASGPGLHLRLGLQVVALTALALSTGVGPAIVAPILVLVVADSVRAAGAGTGGSAVAWATGGVLAHQIAVVAVGPVGVLPVEAGHAAATIGAVLIFLAGYRITRFATESEAARAAVAAEQGRVQAMLAGGSDVTFIVGDGRVTYQSPSTERVMGYAPDSLLGRDYLDLVHPDDRARTVEFVRGLLDEPGASGLLACRLQAADGVYLPVESSCRNLLHDPAVAGFVVTARDVTERQQLEQQLEHRAFHDDLTGLANRALLLDRLQHTAARVARSGGRYAVLVVDVDGFKPINDTFGHATGDAVLRAVARRLEAATRRSDTIARLASDEFAVLVEEHLDAVDAARIAARILAEVRQPIPTGGADVTVSVSIGIADDRDGDRPEDVLRNADIAMYLAKRDGADRFEVFEPRMHLAVVERLSLESDLQRAIDQAELRCHYQPIVTLTDRRIVGVEALVRWEHPDRGTVSPGEFVPLAEETGLIVGLGRSVLREACSQVATWRHTIPSARDLTVSVNVSMRQFSHGDLLADVRGALADSGLPASALTLELTESALANDADRTIQVLEQLRSLGVRIAIDDFGTGYSSLAYLHRFPVDVLKIDRSFVTSVVSGRQSPLLARAIVELGRSLHLATVAEGIEHDAELAQFRELECTHGQGFLFARPGDADVTGRLLEAVRCEDVPQVLAAAVDGGVHAN
jgi:diguanylate cyclase (GGDEF)-like protein/PAS domain S-box-containing protein